MKDVGTNEQSLKKVQWDEYDCHFTMHAFLLNSSTLGQWKYLFFWLFECSTWRIWLPQYKLIEFYKRSCGMSRRDHNHCIEDIWFESALQDCSAKVIVTLNEMY